MARLAGPAAIPPRKAAVIPALTSPDSTLALLTEGYPFISRRCDRLGSDAFRTRLLLQPAVCMRGADAARLFYSGHRFTRQGAFPSSVQHLLQDEGSVQGLDDESHRHRKEMFLRLLQDPDAAGITGLLEREWRAAVLRWQRAGRVVLFDVANEVLTRVAAAWSGIPLAEEEVPRRAHELAEMRMRAGSIGPANWWARALRNRSEEWVRGLVQQVRAGELAPPEDSALAVISRFRDPDGELLDVPVAGVELLNILRPIAAVSRFVVFAALGLLEHPRWQESFAAGDDADLTGFVQEVRRFYPFFPVVAGRVRTPFTWEGYEFPAGRRVVLDLYGTDHDARAWPDPESFRPERFRDWAGDPYTLVPQGAGDYADDHRCPGEPMTVGLLEQAVRLLTRGMTYRVGVQDLSVSLSRLPTMPTDGFVIHDVRPAG